MICLKCIKLLVHLCSVQWRHLHVASNNFGLFFAPKNMWYPSKEIRVVQDLTYRSALQTKVNLKKWNLLATIVLTSNSDFQNGKARIVPIFTNQSASKGRDTKAYSDSTYIFFLLGTKNYWRKHHTKSIFFIKKIVISDPTSCIEHWSSLFKQFQAILVLLNASIKIWKQQTILSGII